MLEIGWSTWAVTITVSVAILALDRAAGSLWPHRVVFKEASLWSIGYVAIAIGGVDLLFALDSIPAVFGVTESAYIVFTANAFALLGLRALFFLVKSLLERLIYLSTGLAIILAFIGVKLILHWAHVDIYAAVPQITTPVSLGVIVFVLALVTTASLVKTRADPSRKAHAGSLRGDNGGARRSNG